MQVEMNKLTIKQAIVISAYTGILMCDISDLHKDIEKRIGFNFKIEAIKLLEPRIKQMYRDDFISISACIEGDLVSLWN